MLRRFRRWYANDPTLHGIDLMGVAGLVAFTAVCLFAPRGC